MTMLAFNQKLNVELRRLGAKKRGATVKSHLLNNAFEHGVTAWRLVTRSALSNFVIVQCGEL